MSRRELTGDEVFEQISPEVGELDEAALDRLLESDPDAVMTMLATLTAAVDDTLRAKARAAACRIAIDIARQGPAVRGRVGRLRSRPLDDGGGDLDVDAAVEAVAAAGGGVPDPAELREVIWERPDTALCLVVDRSGSMRGEALATAALAAAAVSCRAPGAHAVLAFAGEVDVLRHMGEPPVVGAEGAEPLIDQVLGLTGHGTTDLAGALSAAGSQCALAAAGRRLTVLLSDCRATEPGDMVAAASALDELVVLAPADDDAEAQTFCNLVGARCVSVSGPADVVRALDEALSRR